MTDADPLPGRIAKFLATGASGVVVDLAVLESLHRFAGWHHLSAAVVSFLVAMTWNYSLNRTWTFKAGRLPLVRSYFRYAAGTLGGFGVRMVLQSALEPLVGHLGAAAVGILAGTALNFAASQYWAFHPENRLPAWAKILAALTLLRLLFAALVPVTPEEAYHWNYARHLDWSYYDHPPMVAWGIAIGRLVFGDTPLGLRFAFVLLSAGTGWLAARLATRMHGEAAAPWAVGLLAMQPANFLVGVAGFPDAPLQFFWMLGLSLVWEAAESGRPSRWLAAGVALGAGMLSKYTMSFLAFSLVAWSLATAGRRRVLLSPWAWLSVLVALGVFAPVFYWNWTHDWASFRFQSIGRLEESEGVQAVEAGNYLLGQWWGFLPLTLPLAAVALFRAFRRGTPADRYLAWFFAPMFVAFLGISFFRNAHLLWPGPAHLSLALLMAGVLAAPEGRIATFYSRRWMVPACGLVALMVLAAAHLVWFLPGISPARHVYGWEQVAAAAREERAKLGPRAFYLGLGRKYTTTSLLAFHVNAPLEVHGATLLGEKSLQYDYWSRPAELAGRDAVVVFEDSDKWNYVIRRLEAQFARVELVREVSVDVGRPLGKHPFRPRKWLIYAARDYRPPTGPAVSR